MAAFVVVLLVAVGVVVLLMRAASAAGGGNRGRTQGPPRARAPRAQQRPLAPDDDPEFLRELDRRRTRDDGAVG